MKLLNVFSFLGRRETTNASKKFFEPFHGGLDGSIHGAFPAAASRKSTRTSITAAAVMQRRWSGLHRTGITRSEPTQSCPPRTAAQPWQTEA